MTEPRPEDFGLTRVASIDTVTAGLGNRELELDSSRPLSGSRVHQPVCAAFIDKVT